MRFILFFFLLLSPFVVFASASVKTDTDQDGLLDEAEIHMYYTNPNMADTDGDGFLDGEEIGNNYSPHQAQKRLWDADYDGDGLNDKLELVLGSDMGKKDTDNDSFDDKVEVFSGFSPLSGEKNAFLPQKIEIGIKEQRLRISSAGAILGEFPVSTGVDAMPTPLGVFAINFKHPKAWSKYGLWMPWWMSFKDNKYGIHELPLWPNGAREGENHLGTKASHGCVRLGADAAKVVYEWARIGTPVEIKKTLN